MTSQVIQQEPNVHLTTHSWDRHSVMPHLWQTYASSRDSKEYSATDVLRWLMQMEDKQDIMWLS